MQPHGSGGQHVLGGRGLLGAGGWQNVSGAGASNSGQPLSDQSFASLMQPHRYVWLSRTPTRAMRPAGAGVR